MGLTQKMQTAGFRFGRSRTAPRLGATIAIVMVIGLIALIALGQYGAAWLWLLAFIACMLVWFVILWTFGDSDSRDSQRAIYGDGGFAPSVTDPTHVINEDSDHH